MNIRFLAKAGRTWCVEGSGSLGIPDPWTRIGEPIAGDDSWKEIPVPMAGARGFYRASANEWRKPWPDYERPHPSPGLGCG